MARKHNSSICVISQSIEDYLNEKIRLYGQSLLANSTNKLFFLFMDKIIALKK